MIQEEAGPEHDRRMAIRPAMDDGTPGFNHNFLNFAITDQWLGPNSQPNARLAISVTYYDDPELVERWFRPEVWQSELPNGNNTLVYAPASQNVVLQGSGQWVDAYFELENVKFQGVNQGPQAAARFVLNGKIFFSRVRYAVIRQCGPDEGVNRLEGAKPVLQVSHQDGIARLRWPAGQAWRLYYNDQLGEGAWQPVEEAPMVEDFFNVVEMPADNSAMRFFRLGK